jgi:hypothetical protein
MPFEMLAELIAQGKHPTVELRSTNLKMFVFELNQIKQYLRFEDQTRIREVKTIICPGASIRHVQITHQKQPLGDDQEIGRLDSRDIFSVKLEERDTLQITDDEGRVFEVSVAKGEKVDSRKLIKTDRHFALQLLGEKIDEPKYSPHAELRLMYDKVNYRFEIDGKVESRQLEPKQTSDSLKAQFGEKCIFLIDNHLLWPGDIVPPGSLVKVIKAEKAPTFGELRKQEPNRLMYSVGDRVLVNSFPVAAAPKFKKSPSPSQPPREFSFRLPSRQRPRSFYFDYEATVADACEIIADVSRISFPPFALYYKAERLVADDFLFDIGYGTNESIEVRFTNAAQEQVWVNIGAKTVPVACKGSVAELKTQLIQSFGLPKDFDLVCHGTVLAQAEKRRLTNSCYIYVYVSVVDSAAKPAAPLPFEFITASQDPKLRPAYQVSYSPTRTVAEAKAELSRALGRPAAQLSIIDHQEKLCLEDTAKLNEKMRPGKQFTVLFCDPAHELTADQMVIVHKYVASKDPKAIAQGRALFLQCAARTDIFARTCKKRGFY